MYNHCEENEWKLKIIGIFRSPRYITLEKCSIVPKTELDRDMLMMNLHTKFLLSKCNRYSTKNITVTANNWNFSKSRDI